MGKVRQRVIERIENGPQIASNVTTDHLITAGVSNWGGSALAAALFVLSQCPVHSWYARRGVGKEREVSLEDVLNSVEKVRCLLNLDLQCIHHHVYPLSAVLACTRVQVSDMQRSQKLIRKTLGAGGGGCWAERTFPSISSRHAPPFPQIKRVLFLLNLVARRRHYLRAWHGLQQNM